MILNPIHKALLTFRKYSMRYLLMGGQACILYGAAEFSRDLDIAIAIDENNLKKIRQTLQFLQARTIFVPPLDVKALSKGHACHFRCHGEGVEGLRIDMMTKMRGCAKFDQLYKRRSIIKLPELGEIGLLSLPDLIQAKKTQRDKDWSMIRRLVEADVIQSEEKPGKKKLRFWFQECRTPSILVELAQKYPKLCSNLVNKRPLLCHAMENDESRLEASLADEENLEKTKDREYWRPLRKELEKWRSELRSNDKE